MTAVAEQTTYIAHQGLVGAKSLCTNALYEVFVTSPATMSLSMFGSTTTAPEVSTANGYLSALVLGDRKINGCVYDSGTVWVVSPVALYKITVSGSTLTLANTFTKTIAYTDSVFVSGTSVICSGPVGTGLYAYDSTTGAETGRAPFLGVLGAICQSGSTFYVFDKYAGNYSTVTCVAGVLTKTNETLLPNVRNVTSARIDGSVLAVTCAAKHALYTYNFADPTAPVLASTYTLLDKFPTGSFPSGATAGYYVSTMLYYNQGQTLAQGVERGAMADVQGRVVLYPGPGRMAFMLVEPPGAQSLWDHAHADAPYTIFSNGDQTVEISSTRTVNALYGHNDRKRYFEVHYDLNGGAPQVCIVGVALATAAPTTYLGGDNKGFGWYEQDGTIQWNGTSTAYSATPFPAVSKTIGVVFDPILGTLEFYLNNVSQGVYAHASLIGAVMYPAWSAGSSASNTVTATLRSRPSNLAYAVPTGAVYWDHV